MVISKIRSFIWKILLVLIFLRPLLSEYAFLVWGFWYISGLIFFLVIYLMLTGRIALFSPLLNFCVLLFIIAILISIIFSGFTNWTLFELYLFIPNILIFYVAGKLKSEQKRELISIIFFAATLVSVYAIYQYFIGFGHLFEYIKQTFSKICLPEFLVGRRVFATFVSPNIFASYIVMMLFLGIGLLVSAYQKRKVAPWIYIYIFMMAISLLLTKSLGGILVFFITSILFLFCIYLYILPNLGFKKMALRIINTHAIIILFGFILMASLFIFHRMPQSFDIKNPNNSLIQRFYYWKASLSMFRDYPTTGVGWRKFGLLYEFYKPLPANISHYSHNVFLQIMAETGIFGFLTFLWIVFIFLQRGLRIIKNNDEQQGLNIGLFCSGCAFLLHNLIDLSFYFGQVSFFWWIILGLFAEPSIQNA
jgi:O-antigen ligase